MTDNSSLDLDNPTSNDSPNNVQSRTTLMAGIAFLVTACVLTFLAGLYLMDRPVDVPVYIEYVLASTIGLAIIVCVLRGAHLLLRTLLPPTVVIPKHERDLLHPIITGGDEKAMDQYVRVSSLRGATGAVT